MRLDSQDAEEKHKPTHQPRISQSVTFTNNGIQKECKTMCVDALDREEKHKPTHKPRIAKAVPVTNNGTRKEKGNISQIGNTNIL